jgi:hypothetical protein
MTEYRTLRAASRAAVNDHENSLIVGPRGPVLTDDFDVPRRPGDRARVESPLKVVARVEDVLRSLAGPLVVVAAALALAIVISIAPAPDLPAPVAGPLSGHSALHFPR